MATTRPLGIDAPPLAAIGAIRADPNFQALRFNPNVAQGLNNFDARLILENDPFGAAMRGANTALQTLNTRETLKQNQAESSLTPLKAQRMQAENELFNAQLPALMEDAKLTPQQKAERETEREINKAIKIDDAKAEHEVSKINKYQDQAMARLDKEHEQKLEQMVQAGATAEQLEAQKAKHTLERDQINQDFKRLYGTKLGLKGVEPDFETKEKIKAQNAVSTKKEEEKVKFGFNEAERIKKEYAEKLPKYGEAKAVLDQLESANEALPGNFFARGNMLLASKIPGVNDIGKLVSPNFAAFSEGTKSLLLSAKPEALGPQISNSDIKIAAERGPSLAYPKELNQFLINRQREVIKSYTDKAEMYEAYAAQNGHDAAGRDFDQKWNEYVKANPYLIKAKDGQPVPNPNRIPSDVFFGSREPTSDLEKAQLIRSSPQTTPEEKAHAEEVIRSQSPFSGESPWNDSYLKKNQSEVKSLKTIKPNYA